MVLAVAVSKKKRVERTLSRKREGGEKPMESRIHGIEKGILQKLYNHEGMTIQEIADYYDVSLNTIWRRMKEYNIKTRSISEANKKDPSITKKYLKYKYEQGMSTRAIACYYDVSRSTILRWMEKYGIRRRTISESKRKDFGIIKEDLERMYEEERMSQKEIGNYFCVNQVTISNRMREHNIRVRSIAEVRTIYKTKEEEREGDREAVRRYAKTDKGKEAIGKHHSKRRGLSSIFLNSFFTRSEGHHIDKEHVVYMPTELHRSIKHNVWTGESMEKINEVAFEYITEETFDKLIVGEI